MDNHDELTEVILPFGVIMFSIYFIFMLLVICESCREERKWEGRKETIS